MKKPLSVYIHIPFCLKKCNYCDFLSFSSTENEKEAYTKALIKEIKAYKDQVKDYSVISIFIGGGTPSLLNSDHIQQIIKNIKINFDVDPQAEITIEINPGTVNEEKLSTYKGVGINRLSIGLQSTDDLLLKKLGRIHNYATFLQTYETARAIGYDNINIDLIFGLPDQSLKQWEKTIEKVIQLAPEHISAYSLMIEEETPFYEWLEKGDLVCLDETVERSMYHQMIQLLMEANYAHYEISNFAKKEYPSQHNLTYWTGKTYLGLGLGAASYFENQRFSNTRQLAIYLEHSSMPDRIREDLKTIDLKQAIEEFMFLGLRLIEGVSKKEFNQRFGQSIDVVYHDIILDLTQKGLIKQNKNKIQLTKKGIDVSNYVLSHFILD